MTTGAFKKAVWSHYKTSRRNFAWRNTRNPYRILVSEIMLQQTQTDRVTKKYTSWLRRFPTAKSLADASLKEVLSEWKGLGYNRRALNLKRTAEAIVVKHKNKFPKAYAEILDLPGIGPYTAGAIMAFAYNKPFPIIETNIRTVYIHFFFSGKSGVYDKDILKLIEKTLDKENPREWYYALMDYGVMLKKTVGNLGKQSRHYTKQSPFKGSARELRSNILNAVSAGASTASEIRKYVLKKKLNATDARVKSIIAQLETEGFVALNKTEISLR
jgi:A/G-specific adenine glycosylase